MILSAIIVVKYKYIYTENIRYSADRLSAIPIIGGDFQTPASGYSQTPIPRRADKWTLSATQFGIYIRIIFHAIITLMGVLTLTLID